MTPGRRNKWKPTLNAVYWILEGDLVRAELGGLQKAIDAFTDQEGMSLQTKMGYGYCYLERALRGEPLGKQDAWYVETILTPANEKNSPYPGPTR